MTTLKAHTMDTRGMKLTGDVSGFTAGQAVSVSNIQPPGASWTVDSVVVSEGKMSLKRTDDGAEYSVDAA